MRKKLLGTMAALLAGAGGVLAQSPNRTGARFAAPTTNPQVSANTSGVRQAQFAAPDAGAPPMGGPPGMMDPGMGGMGGMGGPPGMMNPGMMDPGMGPMWPPQGPYMGNTWERPPVAPIGQNLRSGGGAGANGVPKFWFDGQYLLMFPKSQPVGFPLLTSGAPATSGIVGLSATSILHGGGNLSLGTSHGFRLSGGFFRPEDQRLGFEMSALYTSPTSNATFVRSGPNGVPVLARPFTSTAAANTPASILFSFPGFTSGSALSRATTEHWGMEANGLWNIYRSCGDGKTNWFMNLVGGFRYMELEESIQVDSAATLLPGAVVPFAGVAFPSPTTFSITDRFETQNKFYGANVGLQTRLTIARWFFGMNAKVGLGVMHQELRISGSSGLNNPTVPVVAGAVGGLLANASNIGTFRNDTFGIVSDINGNVGYQWTPWLTTTVGYNFIHMNAVARPGNAFNGQVDPALVPSSPAFGTPVTGSPAVVIKQDDFWTHGVNFGFYLHY